MAAASIFKLSHTPDLDVAEKLSQLAQMKPLIAAISTPTPR